jgi:plastocyanin
MSLHRVFPALVVALVAALALAGCGKIQNSYGNATKSTPTPPAAGAAASPGASATQAPATTSTVNIQNFAFVPQTLTIKAGTKVTWTNNDSTQHDVTSTDGPAIDAATTDLFSSGVMNQGASFSYTFTKAGTYYYECTIHASMATMHAKVVVQ